MKKIIFLLTSLILITACNNDKDEFNNNGQLGPIVNFLIRLVDTEGNWIEGIEEKEMKLFVADSNWNTLGTQPDNTPPENSHPMWWIEKHYNYIGNGKEEFVGGKKELLYIDIVTLLKDLSYSEKNDDNYGEYLVLEIDENTSINIQLFYKEFYNHAGPCIEKFICNGKEYINIEYVRPDDPDPRNRALIRKANDIVIE